MTREEMDKKYKELMEQLSDEQLKALIKMWEAQGYGSKKN